MRVLMLSLDRGLLGTRASGDVVNRHQKYADAAGFLDVIVFADGNNQPREIAPNLRVFPTRSSKLAHFRRAVEIGLELNRQEPYDLLVTQDFTSPAGLRLKKILKTPWIVNIHGMFFSFKWLGFNPIYWYLLFLIKRAVRLADGFRVNNNDIRDRLMAWGIRKPILVQPTPIDISKFRNIETKRRRTNTDVLKVLYVGRLSPEKNVAMLIRAFKRIMGEFELKIVGAGPEEMNLKRLAADDLRIEFVGQRPIDELPEIYWSAEVFVLPSHTESYGQVLLQAAVAGLAIISTATPGAKTILGEGESGVLVPVGDQKKLEQELRNLLTKTFEREYWAKKAQEMAERYDAAAGIERTAMFWKEIAKTPRRGS